MFLHTSVIIYNMLYDICSTLLNKIFVFFVCLSVKNLLERSFIIEF